MTEAERNATTVWCPKCEAEEGEPCWTDDGEDYAAVHPERVAHHARLCADAVKFYEQWGGLDG